MAWQKDFFERWQIVTTLVPTQKALRERARARANISKGKTVTDDPKLTSPGMLILLQILFLRVKKTKNKNRSVQNVYVRICASWPGDRPSNVGDEQANDMHRKAANERPAHPASRLARPGTSWNQGQL